MFEKFTEKALNVILEAQNIAIYDHSDKVLSEHLLLALVKETRGFCAKIFSSYNVTYDALAKEIYMTLDIEEADLNSSIPFSEDFKRILKRTMDLVDESGNSTVHYEHLVLAAINDKYSKISQYLENLGFDIETIIVTDKNKNPNNIEGIKVNIIYDIANELKFRPIIIAVQECFKAEVIGTLWENGFIKICVLEDDILI